MHIFVLRQCLTNMIMEKDTKNKIEYIVVCISEFANRFKIPTQQAYAYLKRYKGIDYLDEFYDVEHLFSIEDTIDNVTSMCKQNGGTLA